MILFKASDLRMFKFYVEKKRMYSYVLQHVRVRKETKGTQYPCFYLLRFIVIEGRASYQTIVQHIGYVFPIFYVKLILSTKLQRCRCTYVDPYPCVLASAPLSPRPSIAVAPSSPLLWCRLCSCAAGPVQSVQFLMLIRFVLLRVSGSGLASHSGDGKSRDSNKC
ncbi:hypothetical protein PIB30_020369 [Stylosanthes scabra]|uniref:Uncharacterized protein n=1 Tax=Stylosanthes scabra TaxID=79078 RepID=A0ABU6Q8H8_9FABA|nr:hypothetical protein [Stylosanthes scabra]